MNNRFLIRLLVPLLALVGVAASAGASTGYLVVAPDRGFLGNEEVRDAFAPFAEDHPARLVFAAEPPAREAMNEALAALTSEGVDRLVVLPLFLSDAHPRLAATESVLAEIAPAMEIARARPFGASYLAVEVLRDRLRAAQAGHGEETSQSGHEMGSTASNTGRGDLVVVGSGATSEAERAAMAEDLKLLAAWAAEGMGYRSVRAIVGGDLWSEAPEVERAFESELAVLPADATVVPFDLGFKLDGMMQFSAGLRRQLPEEVTLAAGEVTPHPAVGLWLSREASRHAPLADQDLGVVFLAHGADWHWNETMRQAVASLAERYRLEFCFSMADRDLVERALARLEERGAKAAVVVRVFGLESSFRGTVEGMLGLDVEGPDGLRPAPVADSGHMGGHGGHGGHGMMGSPERIRTALLTSTAGGLEDHELFAQALLDRARELSTDPERETLLITAHGAGADADNDHWKGLLASIASQMRDLGAEFADIETVTWREDWPDKSEPEVVRAREIVERAAAEGGRVLVVPARTTGEGPETRLLDGLPVAIGEGFAPHPLFARWVEEQIRTGVAALRQRSTDPWVLERQAQVPGLFP
ncbi:MAG: CbiX/SirB N-terminal domain-containing protein [Thermoanaerobaculia bacterium]